MTMASGRPRPTAKELLDFWTDLAAERALQKLEARGALTQGPPDFDKWIDSKEAADYLAISVADLHKLTAARAIPFEQEAPGHKCFFKRSQPDERRRNGGSRAWKG